MRGGKAASRKWRGLREGGAARRARTACAEAGIPADYAEKLFHVARRLLVDMRLNEAERARRETASTSVACRRSDDFDRSKLLGLRTTGKDDRSRVGVEAAVPRTQQWWQHNVPRRATGSRWIATNRGLSACKATARAPLRPPSRIAVADPAAGLPPRLRARKAVLYK
eukprot:4688407-Pleurochrysis_carterae.AAC.2